MTSQQCAARRCVYRPFHFYSTLLQISNSIYLNNTSYTRIVIGAMSFSKEFGNITDSDSSECDDAELVNNLREKISKLEESNQILEQERDQEKWSHEEQMDILQKEIEGETVIIRHIS